MTLFERAMASAAPETRTPRFLAKCRYCKGKWAEDLPASEVRRNVIAVGLRHACPRRDLPADIERVRQKTREIMARREMLVRTQPALYLPRPEEDIFREQWAAFVFPDVISGSLVSWKNTGSPTECGARCMAAQGPACDCRCKGKNHGGSHVV